MSLLFTPKKHHNIGGTSTPSRWGWLFGSQLTPNFFLKKNVLKTKMTNDFNQQFSVFLEDRQPDWCKCKIEIMHIYAAVKSDCQVGDVLPSAPILINPPLNQPEYYHRELDCITSGFAASEKIAEVELTEKSTMIYDDCPGKEVSHLKIVRFICQGPIHAKIDETDVNDGQ